MQSWPCPCRVGSTDERGNKWAHVLVIVNGQPRYRISGARLLVQSLLSAPHCANLYKAVGPYIPTDTVLINSPCVSREAIGGGFKPLDVHVCLSPWMTFFGIVGSSETVFNPGSVSFVLQISSRFDRRESVFNDT